MKIRLVVLELLHADRQVEAFFATFRSERDDNG
jgi:hypothetical protein